VATADIVVTVTHTFSAPHVQSTSTSMGTAQYVEQIKQATSTAITAAVKGLRAARVGYGTGECDVNVNRDVLTADGWWLGTGEAGASDKSVGVTRFDDEDGNPIAVLMNYSVQSSVMMESVMASGDLPITADLAGAAVQHVEKQYGGAVVGFFLVGSCGDQAPAFRSKRYTIDKDKKWSQVEAQDAGWLLLTVQGERLGTEAVRVSETIRTAGGGASSPLRLVTDTVTIGTTAGGASDGADEDVRLHPHGHRGRAHLGPPGR
jgi:neutral ceramidase